MAKLPNGYKFPNYVTINQFIALYCECIHIPVISPTQSNMLLFIILENAFTLPYFQRHISTAHCLCNGLTSMACITTARYVRNGVTSMVCITTARCVRNGFTSLLCITTARYVRMLNFYGMHYDGSLCAQWLYFIVMHYDGSLRTHA